MPMSQVVAISEGVDESNDKVGRWLIVPTGSKTAADFLVSRLFTDAVFSNDIRSIQLIINRIDGGLPKDTEVNQYVTEFGDCINELLSMEDREQTMVKPDDTVMMALCKSLFSIATQDIFWDEKKLRKKRPSDSQKKERDAAMRMILERAGGRKTLSSVTVDTEDIEVAEWIKILPESTSSSGNM